MKAVKVVKPFRVEICEIEKPSIKNGKDVIIKITSGGICGSDIQIWNGTNSLATYPRIIGHEFGGVVEQIGEDVTQVAVGDKVAVDPVVSCGHCYACKIGRPNVCSSLEVMGVHRDGGFAEYIVANEANVHKFYRDFDSSLLGIVEPYTIGAQINSRGQISQGDKVLIMGSGPIALCTLQMAKKNGAFVMVTDLIQERLDLAVKMGADETVLIGRDDLQKKVDEITGHEGMPVIVDTVCLPSSFEQSVQLASQAGRIVVIGLKSQPAAITQADITKKELTIVGSRLNNHRFDEVIAQFENGNLNPEWLKTQEFHYSHIEDAFKMIAEHPQQVIKIVLKFD